MFDFSKYTLSRDVIALLSVYVLYASVPWDTFVSFLKLYAFVLLVRFFLGELTTVKKENKKYLQTSGHVALFTLVVLIASSEKIYNMENKIFLWLIILAYAALNVAVRAHYTTDVIYTLMLVHMIYSQGTS
jgi:hypothetical protein